MSEQRSRPALALVPADPGNALKFRRPADLPVASPAEEAFCALFARRYDGLRRYAFAELRDRDAAEDVVQGAFVAAWMQFFRDGAPPPERDHDALIFRMVKFRLLNAKRDRARVAANLRVYLTLWVNRARRWMVPSEYLEHHELVAALESAVNAMSPREREVFLLRRESGLSFEEIAGTLGVSQVTVNSLMHKAQRVLRTHVSKAGFAQATPASKRGRIE